MTTRCCICHRALKTLEAIVAGIGPKCAKRHGRQIFRARRLGKAKALFDLKAQTLGVPLFDLEAM